MMRIGLSVPDFTWPSGPEKLATELAAVAKAADAYGFETLWVMDHFFQIRYNGPAENDMLEGYTTLGYLAAVTERIQLGTLVTGVHHRHPGLLVKIVTTLDVLSGGRAVLGLGAGWNEEESRGLGIPFPTTKERFEQLEETLQIAKQMWRGDEKPYAGKHFQLDRPMNSPQALQKPHPPILIGGSGEKKTLRLVAQYGDACNIFPGPELPHKLDALRGHCDAVGRDDAEIQKTTVHQVPENFDEDELVETFAGYATQGIDAVHLGIKPAHRTDIIERIGERVIPAVADL
jgi:F420-dependent oxidoreductase-like protein